MNTSLWRVFALAGCIATIALIAGDLALPPDFATYGFTARATFGAEFAVTEVDPGSSSANAGIVAGDYLEPLPGFANYVALSAPSVGARLEVDIRHGTLVRRATLVGAPNTQGTQTSLSINVLYQLLRLVIVVVAILIVLWRADRPDARALATFFIAFSFGLVQSAGPYPPVVVSLLFLVQQFAFLIALQQACVFAALFPYRSPRGIRHWLERASPYALAALFVAYWAGMAIGIFAGNPAVSFVNVGFALVFIAGAGVAFVSAFRGADSLDRLRLRWVAISVLTGLAGIVAAVVLEVAAPGTWWSVLPGFFALALPFGVTYAIFRHRLFDVSFVASRTIRFAILSAIVVLAFSGLEWLIGTVLVRVGHVQSIVMEAALALVLGFSMDRMRGRVDRAVGDVFFRERRRAEEALRTFSTECAYIGNPTVLTERTLEVLSKYALVDSAIYLLGDAGEYRVACATIPAPAAIDADDPLLVAMRARRRTIEIDDSAAGTTVPGIVAFPMLLGGALTGFLCCGPRANGEAFDPDERLLIETLTTSVAAALSALETAELKRTLATLTR